MPFGAQVLEGSRTRFRLWAPGADTVELVLPDSANPHRTMQKHSDGWYELVAEAGAGTRYLYRIDGEREVPDPASRCNPEDVHRASVVVDPAQFEWDDHGWRGRSWSEAVIYELHVGTFSPDGTFAGVERRLDYLADLGVTAIELMPLADFPGKRNWGYDGTLHFAPDSSYGTPEDLKRLIAAAHARGLMVFLDVVYNHFGPEGNYLHTYASAFFTDRHKTDWGAAINFDGADARPVRDFFIHNTLYWLEEFHFDGLRFDAVHAIVDDSTPHILVELAEAVRSGPARERAIHLILENDHNEARYLEYRDGAPRWYSAQWNDDQHHAFHVLLTGEKDGYYADYADAPAKHVGRCLAQGYAYQGDPSPYRDGKPRGEPSKGLPPAAFVNFLQNHDQVGNRALGERLPALARPERLKAATFAWLLSPAPPMLFMGEEFAAATPFLFFCDFGPELAKAVTEGRRREFGKFLHFEHGKSADVIPDPNHPDSFERSKLDWPSLDEARHAQWLELYKRLLALRRDHIAPRLAAIEGGSGRYDALSHAALTVSWRMGDGNTLTIALNLSDESIKAPAPAQGKLMSCEPEAARDAYQRGELPPNSAACYLGR